MLCWDKHRVRLGFTFVWRCIVVKDTFVKERHFPDNLNPLARTTIQFVRLYNTSLVIRQTKLLSILMRSCLYTSYSLASLLHSFCFLLLFSLLSRLWYVPRSITLNLNAIRVTKKSNRSICLDEPLSCYVSPVIFNRKNETRSVHKVSVAVVYHSKIAVWTLLHAVHVATYISIRYTWIKIYQNQL